MTPKMKEVVLTKPVEVNIHSVKESSLIAVNIEAGSHENAVHTDFFFSFFFLGYSMENRRCALTIVYFWTF